MEDKDLKDLIKIPEGLDNAVLRGIEKGKKHKRKNKFKVMKQGLVAATFTVALTGGLATVSPQFASALSDIGSAIEDFNRDIFGKDKQKFEDAAVVIGRTEIDKGISVTLDEAILDDNNLIITLLIQGDMFKNYDGNNQNDFVQFSAEGFIDGENQIIGSGTGATEIVNDTTARVMIRQNVAGIDINDNANIRYEMTSIGRGHDMVKGNWDFEFNIDKIKGEKISPKDVKVQTKNGDLWVDRVTVTKLSTTIELKGKENNPDESYLMSTKFSVKDENGRILNSRTGGASMSTKTGDVDMKIIIDEDLTNVANIEITDIVGGKGIYKEIDGNPHFLTQFSGEGEFKEEIIERDVTQEEINNGYALPSVIKYVNMVREFRPLSEIIGDKIKVSDNQEVEILNIEDTSIGTKFTFKTDGYYDTHNLGGLEIFDEEMNDIQRAEDRLKLISVEDANNYIYSVTINKLDSSKKYAVGLPKVTVLEEPTIDMKVKLK